MSEVPAALAEIAEVAGWAAAWALADAKGGQEIFIPRSAGRKHWLTLLVGFEAANLICRHYRSDHTMRLLIPMASALRRERAMLLALEAGQSSNATAAALGVHKRTVYRRRAKLRGGQVEPTPEPEQAPRQGKLF